MLKYPEEVLVEKDERIKFLENLICPNGHDFQRSYKNMIFKEMWKKSNEVSKNNYMKAKEKAEIE